MSSMFACRLVARVRAAFKQFVAARGGNVAITFTIAIIPVIGFVGAAVDYSRAGSARSAMQAAADATALMLSKDAQTLTTSQLSQKASDYFNALFQHSDVSNLTVSQTFTSPQPGTYNLTIAVSGKVGATFTRVMGHQQILISTTGEVTWGVKKLELALALDNTGSMAQSGKLTALKTAAKNLLDTLKKAAKTPGDVKVAIIPFDTTVKIGTAYKDQPWFDVSCSALGSPSGCSSSNWKPYWEGCVRDRTQPYDVQDTPPSTSNSATLYPIYDCGSLTTAMPLTYDWTALNNKIDAMTAAGNTDVTIGLVWAWHALTSSAPFTEAAAPAPDRDKVIIILTDGDNTEAWDNANNKKITTQSTIDKRTAAVCANIKAANIKIYSVRVINGNASLLQSCASNPTMYYDVQQASQLNAVFSAIAQNLANLRIAK
jgi:Flp pilus assembly protein TadG